MPMHLAHMNFAPDNLEAEVDRWHADMVGFDYVTMVTDPVPGGRFQFFLGTREEANSLRAAGKEIPAARIVNIVAKTNIGRRLLRFLVHRTRIR